MREVVQPGRERNVASSGQRLLTVALGVALATTALIEGSHPNRAGLVVLVAVPLVAVVLLDRRAAVMLSVTSAALAFVLPGTLFATSTVHFVRLSGITAACVASAVAAFWRERLATTRNFYDGARSSATESLMRGWRESPTQAPREAPERPADPGQHQRAASLVQTARFDEEALELALEQNDWLRAQWLAKGLLGTWIEVVRLVGPAPASGARSG